MNPESDPQRPDEAVAPARGVPYLRKWWFIVPAVIASMIVLAVLLMFAASFGSYGWVFIVIVPLVAGVFLGYLTEVRHVFLWMLGVVVVFGVIGALFMFHWAGILCGVIAGMVLVVTRPLDAPEIFESPVTHAGVHR